jgi:hypothetical protein
LSVVEEVAGFNVSVDDVKLVDTTKSDQHVPHVVPHLRDRHVLQIILEARKRTLENSDKHINQIWGHSSVRNRARPHAHDRLFSARTGNVLSLHACMSCYFLFVFQDVYHRSLANMYEDG